MCNTVPRTDVMYEKRRTFFYFSVFSTTTTRTYNKRLSWLACRALYILYTYLTRVFTYNNNNNNTFRIF